MQQHTNTPAPITLDLDTVSAAAHKVHANRGAILAALAWLLERLPAIIAGLQSLALVTQGAPATRQYFANPTPEAPEAAPAAAPRIVSEESKAKAKKAKAKGTKKATRSHLERYDKATKKRYRDAGQGPCRGKGCETVLSWEGYAKAKGWACPDCRDGAKANDPEPIDPKRAAAAASKGADKAEGPRACRVCSEPVTVDRKGKPAHRGQLDCADCKGANRWNRGREVVRRAEPECFPKGTHKASDPAYREDVIAAAAAAPEGEGLAAAVAAY